MFSKDTSGDVIADRRFAMAEMLYERGDCEAALDLMAQAEELAPHWPPLPFRRGEILMELGWVADATDAFKTCLRLDPEDCLGAEIKLTLLGAVPKPDTLPSPYVEALFDDYAPRFDTALVENLSYCVPQLLAALIERYRPRTETTAEYILDLGCGTGLAGETVIKRAAWLEGIDLSAGMLEQANSKGIYNALRHGDIIDLLQRSGDTTPCQLALAADVIVYIGALEPLFGAIASRLAPGGLFAFSTQKLDNPAHDFLLGADHRYAHSREYIHRCLNATGLSVLALEEHFIRQDGAERLTGFIVLAEKPAQLPENTAVALESIVPFAERPVE